MHADATGHAGDPAPVFGAQQWQFGGEQRWRLGCGHAVRRGCRCGSHGSIVPWFRENARASRPDSGCDSGCSPRRFTLAACCNGAMSNPQHNPEPQGQGGPAYTKTPASSSPHQPTQPTAKPEASACRRHGPRRRSSARVWGAAVAVWRGTALAAGLRPCRSQGVQVRKSWFHCAVVQGECQGLTPRFRV